MQYLPSLTKDGFMPAKTVHLVIWLPTRFYSAVAATLIETLQIVNDFTGEALFSYEFVSARRSTTSMSGISLRTRLRPSRKMNGLIVLGVPGTEPRELADALHVEARHVRPIIALARRQGARIAATCAGSYLLAESGILNEKRATISWWLKDEVVRRFPRVRWEPARLLVRHGQIYTTGAGFSGLELITTLLVDFGFPDEERRVRKLMVLPPPREFQSPYEFSMSDVVPQADYFERRLNETAEKSLRLLSVEVLARQLGMSERTVTRRFHDELGLSPGKWIQARRLQMARALLEDTRLKISEVCYRVGYQDAPSFCRLFARTTGMTPGEFRKQIRTEVARQFRTQG